MALDGDPLRTLGLTNGASQAEIKAAYRRLAKAFHPDTAGEAAIPRFLAIQAAYETLTGTTVRASGRVTRSGAWRADPERAGATRDGWRGRGPAGTTRPGPEPGHRPAGGRAEGDGAQGGPAEGGRPDGARSSRSGRARGRSDAGPRSRAARDRAPDRATPGSTTYDVAEGEPFDPEWSGASWYGPTSGTYWRINPKEYADPRKHGPEYQARGRRRGSGVDVDGDVDEPAIEVPIDPDPPDEPREPAVGGPPPMRRDARRARAPFGPITPLPGALTGRVALALIGWPPLGAFLAGLIGDATGCSRFAAGCDGSVGIAIWLTQLAVIAILLAVPRLAAISSVGTLAALAVAVPATLLLSIGGGAQERAASIAALTILLTVAYLAGVLFAAVGGSRRLRA
jgi:curved DNA-binding protein CbpA